MAVHRHAGRDQRIQDGRRKLEAWAKTAAGDRARLRSRAPREWWRSGARVELRQAHGQRRWCARSPRGLCFGRRQAFFRDEFLQTMRIQQDGDMRPRNLVGYVGRRLRTHAVHADTSGGSAVEFDGEDVAISWDRFPTRSPPPPNYLRDAGWKRVRRGVTGAAAQELRRPLRAQDTQAARRMEARHPPRRRKEIAGDESAALLLPAGARGSRLLVLDNFHALYRTTPTSRTRWRSRTARPLARRASVSRAWPPTETGLSRTQRMELQDAWPSPATSGRAAGLMGPRTMEAIRSTSAPPASRPTATRACGC